MKQLFGVVTLSVLVVGCAGAGADVTSTPLAAERSIPTGPAADYPMVIGDPFTIEGVTYTPSDALNVDEIGYAAANGAETAGVSAAHRTLPLPSYVEVTSLDSGRTALIRVERRGPMINDRLIALSPAALAQLAIADGAPVRVRRVNPPETDRDDLRRGGEAPLRMETPKGLLEVLKRKLPAIGGVSLRNPVQEQVSGKVPSPGALTELTEIAPPPVIDVTPPTVVPESNPAAPPASKGNGVEPLAASALLTTEPEKRGFAIQVGAFSIRDNAEKLASKLEGYVEPSGKLSLVLTGPFTSRGQAEQALAKARGQGYSDARVVALK